MFEKITGYIYFIQMEEAGPIKIGITRDINKRLAHLQTANPCKLKLLYFFPGGVGTEKELHNILKNYSLEGEWFSYHPKVLQEIEQQKRISAKFHNEWTPDKADPVVDFKDNRLCAL